MTRSMMWILVASVAVGAGTARTGAAEGAAAQQRTGTEALEA
jgi:hypothetical protein